jgi:hypothetical protein
MSTISPLTVSSTTGYPGPFDAFQRLWKFCQFGFEQLMQYPAFARLRFRLQKRPVKTDVLSRDEILKRTGHLEILRFNRPGNALCANGADRCLFLVSGAHLDTEFNERATGR